MERKERITNYVKELEEHVAALEKMHSQIHETAPKAVRLTAVMKSRTVFLEQQILFWIR